MCVCVYAADWCAPCVSVLGWASNQSYVWHYSCRAEGSHCTLEHGGCCACRLWMQVLSSFAVQKFAAFPCFWKVLGSLLSQILGHGKVSYCVNWLQCFWKWDSCCIFHKIQLKFAWQYILKNILVSKGYVTYMIFYWLYVISDVSYVWIATVMHFYNNCTEHIARDYYYYNMKVLCCLAYYQPTLRVGKTIGINRKQCTSILQATFFAQQ